MSSTAEQEWLEERARPFYITVYRAGAVWQVAICEHGFTMAERLNPRTVVTLTIPENRAAQLSTNRELLSEVASMMFDACDGILGPARLLPLL